MDLSLSRRRMLAFAAAAPLAAQVSTAPPVGAPAPPQPPATPDQRLAKAYSDVQDVSKRLRGIQISMSLEPAFSFRV